MKGKKRYLLAAVMTLAPGAALLLGGCEQQRSPQTPQSENQGQTQGQPQGQAPMQNGQQPGQNTQNGTEQP